MAKTKEEIKAMVDEITGKTTDSEVRRLAYAFAEKGMPVDDAIRRATDDIQKLNDTPTRRKKKETGRYRVRVTFTGGPADGRTTEYWNDVAEIQQRKGKIRIDGKV